MSYAMTGNEIIEPEVYSVPIVLRALKEAIISPAHGYQTYAFFLNLLRVSDQSLADELHGLDGAKPFTVSSLRGKFGQADKGLRVIPESTYSLRLTFLRSEVFAHFLDGAIKWGGNVVEIGSSSFLMEQVNPVSKNDSSSGFQSYQGILDSASAERQVELQFLSPTAFRSGGKRNVIFPDPVLVFGSFFNRWQVFSPVKLGDALTSWLEKILVARYQLETRILDFGSYQEVGFTGRCRYELEKDTPEEVVIALNALANFAFYCGTGAKTTMGMGQTRRLNYFRTLSRRARS